jgi:hypothetical protein
MLALKKSVHGMEELTQNRLHGFIHGLNILSKNRVKLEREQCKIKMRGKHAIYDIKYHFVWIPKYRKHILTKELKKRVQKLHRDHSKQLKLF